MGVHRREARELVDPFATPSLSTLLNQSGDTIDANTHFYAGAFRSTYDRSLC